MNLEKEFAGERDAEKNLKEAFMFFDIAHCMKFGSREDVIQLVDSFVKELEKFDSFEEMSVSMKEKCLKVRQMMQMEQGKSVNAMMEKARQYIEEHYWDSKLCVEDLCSHLNVSATYFSVMFKKKFGMNFISYLTKVRLDRAAELLEHTEDKSYMIAEKVGYTEPNYFSYVFKKQYGVSPTKYRVNRARVCEV